MTMVDLTHECTGCLLRVSMTWSGLCEHCYRKVYPGHQPDIASEQGWQVPPKTTAMLEAECARFAKERDEAYAASVRDAETAARDKAAVRARAEHAEAEVERLQAMISAFVDAHEDYCEAFEVQMTPAMYADTYMALYKETCLRRGDAKPHE